MYILYIYMNTLFNQLVLSGGFFRVNDIIKCVTSNFNC